MTNNPLQQQSEANAASVIPINGFSKFHNEIGKHVFDPVKYGAAISKKLQAIVTEGALEHKEFNTDLTEFVKEGMILVALAGIAVGHKGTSPRDDLAVLAQLESLVVTAAKFIPLIEKLYSAEEGVAPVPEPLPVEVKENVVTIQNLDSENDAESKDTRNATGRDTSSTDTAQSGITETANADATAEEKSAEIASATDSTGGADTSKTTATESESKPEPRKWQPATKLTK